jgi:deferrochelatase/peroxidase EfeB
METCLTSRGHQPVIYVPFMDLPDKEAEPEKAKLAKLEPFGFVDGISQPVIRGTYKALRGADPIHMVEPGEFILGYPDNRGNLPAGPTLPAIHDPGNLLPIAAATQHGFAQPIVNDQRDLGRNGTFLAVRQLEQHPSAFWDYCAGAAKEIAARFPKWTNVSREFVGAKLVGRWPDGSSMVRFPYTAGSEEDEEHVMMRAASGAATAQVPAPPPPVAPARALQAHPVPRRRAKVEVKATASRTREVAVTPDNDFLFGMEDPQGLRCPFGAHIRRANPRESFDPGSQEQLAITNRHRILRVGRRYQEPAGAQPGLFFMCLNADLERQFEFVQQTWLQSPSFHGLVEERDPLLGMRDAGSRPSSDDGFTIPTRESPVRLRGMPDFVRTLGGGYFFVPGRSVLWWLSS